MLKNIILVLFSVTLLSGCSYKPKSNHQQQQGADLGQDTALAAEFERNVGDRVFFKFNSSDVSSEGKDTLANQAKWLNEHPAVAITLEGHCDERGTREYNIALGEKRAHAAKKLLVKNGVRADRIETVSYGKERPAVVGNDEESYSKNRRAVTAIR